VRLQAFSRDDDDRPLTAAPVDLEIGDSPIDNLELVLMPEFELPGHIEWDGPAAQAHQIHDAKLRLDALRTVDGAIAGAIGEDGAFRLAELKPDRYSLSLDGMPGNVYVKSMRLGTREMTGGILDVRRGASNETLSLILSSAGGQLSGVVRDADGPLTEAAVGLVEDRPGRFDILRTARTSGDGAYAFHGLAPGDYKVFVFDAEDLASLVQSGTLGIYEGAAEKVEVIEGDKLTRDLRP
jgi:hypothetical protein